jgi:hypothetical protein
VPPALPPSLSPRRDQYGYASLDKFCRKRRQSVVFAKRPAIINNDVFAFNIAKLSQPLMKRDDAIRVGIG